ncbi:unnamed protein product [Leptosia nina]|uniref:Tc1-like transposase DDE domain-containing protein n=1 Tax=Leptosia nina TaxID=320188 RepID=A0AAV1IYL7_9NEOP
MVNMVYKYMQKEATDGVNNVNQVHKRTAEATGASTRTVQRILKEAKSSEPLLVIRTPGKKRPRKKPVTDIHTFDYCIIRKCIHNFHNTNGQLPTTKELLIKLRNDINFQGSGKSLSRIIKNLSFRWKTIQNRRKILIEKTDIRFKRINYLDKIKDYRSKRRPIIYIHVTQFSSKSWSSKVKKPTIKEKCVTIIHAGSEAGFIPNALLMIAYEPKGGDCNDDIHFNNYKTWLRTQLLPFIPPKSVVVLDSSSYNTKQYDTAPTPYSKKAEMHSWLTEKGIPYDQHMLKPQLYQLISLFQDKCKNFEIDKFFTAVGHNILRLPRFHPDLSPMELAWAEVKGCVSASNFEWNENSVMKFFQEKVDKMDANTWRKICDKVKSAEEIYVKNDRTIDLMTEEYIVGINDNSDSGSATEYSSSSSDEEDPLAMDDEQSGELRQEVKTEDTSDSD